MRTRGLRLGRIAGVEVNADYGVLLICAFLAYSFANGLLPGAVAGHVPATYWSIGTIGALAFMASLLGHEMAHSVVARRNGLTVEGITLWMFGGVAIFSGEPKGPGAEFRIAAAGPAASFVIGGALWGSAIALTNTAMPELWIVMLGWLGVINVFLAVFNLLPGAPLDGGRILGSILWKVRGDRATGRYGAAQVGKGIALLLVALGIAQVVRSEDLSGIWTAMVGWFLFTAAKSESAHYSAERSMAGITVGAVMASPVQVATSWSTVKQVIEGPFAHSTQKLVPVTDVTGKVVGTLQLDQLTSIPAENWATTVAADVMQSPPGVEWLEPDDSMVMALQHLGPVGYAFVISGRDLVGMIGPEEIQRAAHLAAAGKSRRPQSWTPATPSPDAPPTSPPMAATPATSPDYPDRPPTQDWRPPTQDWEPPKN